MKVSQYQYDPRPAEPLIVTAVRYQPDIPPPDGLTLILAHATGSHKETWVPLLKYLFRAQESSTSDDMPKLLEAWSIECPNHGESAAINERNIEEKFSGLKWSGWIYPRSMRAFLLSKPDGIDFCQRTLVAVGHSHGGNSLVLLDSLRSSLPFKAFILLDPTLGRESSAKDHMQRVLTQLTWNKRDTWPSKKVASKDLAQQPGFRNWHPDVLSLFIEKGLREHPAAKLPEPWAFKGGVTLSCSRANEAASNLANDHHVYAFDYLQQLYRDGRIVHLIHSKEDEFNGSALKTAQTRPEPISCRGPASVQHIEKGGHMFVQTCPEQTARAILKALQQIQGPNAVQDSHILQKLPETKARL